MSSKLQRWHACAIDFLCILYGVTTPMSSCEIFVPFFNRIFNSLSMYSITILTSLILNKLTKKRNILVLHNVFEVGISNSGRHTVNGYLLLASDRSKFPCTERNMMGNFFDGNNALPINQLVASARNFTVDERKRACYSCHKTTLCRKCLPADALASSVAL